MTFRCLKTILKAYFPKPHKLSKHLFNAAYLKKKGIENNKNDIKILALGSSHCEHGFDANLIDNSFNLGIIDQDLYSAHQIFNKYIDQLPNLKHVILFYSIHSQGHELVKTRAKKYAALMHYIFEIPYEDAEWLKKWKKAARHRLKTFDDANFDYKNFFGYVPEEKNPNIIPPTAEFRCSNHLRENRRPIRQNHHVFEMAEVCQKKGIQFSIIIPPYRSDYQKELEKYHFSDEELFYELFHWAKKNNIPILNELHSKDYQWDNFYDSDHLDDSGAKILTKKIAHFIHVPLK